MKLENKNPNIIIVSGKARSGKNTVADMIEKNTNKKTVQIAYADYLKMYAKKITDEEKPRELLQILGVELIKTHVNENMLINRIVEDIKVYSFFFEQIIITDARFESEITTIKSNFKNSISIRVIGGNSDLTEKQKNHKTETGLDEFNDYDFVIENNGTLNDLEEKVREILK